MPVCKTRWSRRPSQEAVEAAILAGTGRVQDVAASSLTGNQEVAAWSLTVKQEVEASTLLEALKAQVVGVSTLRGAQLEEREPGRSMEQNPERMMERNPEGSPEQISV